MNSFYSAKWENIFKNLLTIQLLIKYQNIFSQWYIFKCTMAVIYTEA